jgi:hypothetical protein
LREGAEALLTMGLFVLFALGWAAVAGRAAEGRSVYSDGAMARLPSSRDPSPPRPSVWLVDGFNVLHVAVLHGPERGEWWKESTRARLVELARCFREHDTELWIVFDGSRPLVEAGGENPDAPVVRVVFAPSADEWLLARLRTSREPERMALVTADRKLASRARQRGAQVIAPHAFLALCNPPSSADAPPAMQGGSPPGAV